MWIIFVIHFCDSFLWIIFVNHFCKTFLWIFVVNQVCETFLGNNLNKFWEHHFWESLLWFFVLWFICIYLIHDIWNLRVFLIDNMKMKIQNLWIEFYLNFNICNFRFVGNHWWNFHGQSWYAVSAWPKTSRNNSERNSFWWHQLVCFWRSYAIEACFRKIHFWWSSQNWIQKCSSS